MNALKGLNCFVTGGGSGLGLAVVQRLARLGSRVVTLDLTPKPIDNVVTLKGDIRRDEDIKEALSHCVDESGNQRLDCLVNCAGVANAFKVFNFQSRTPQRLSDFSMLFEINVLGTFNAIRLSVPLMAENHIQPSGIRGTIINTSSTLATEGHEGQVGYSAASMAINSMTLPMARDLSEAAIRVNTIAPGFFATPLVLRCDSPELMDYIKMTTPCPSRLGDPEEFAALVENIITNPMINGEVIRIDGANRWPERG